MEDTIAAIATPYGEGGIGVIRISGEKAFSIVKEIVEPASAEQAFTARKMSYGKIVDQRAGKQIDECMAVCMKGPKTYTGEDVAEIQCHGSMISLKNTLQLILETGARMAEPGEFTKRAFLNGRLDLSQAEAVMDLVKARSDRGFDVALSQLSGNLSRKIGGLRRSLLDALVDITVNLDYPDEDIEEMTVEALVERLLPVMEEVGRLLDSADTGRVMKEGLRVVICGRPNVGKSSLMNALLKENRAIVTDIPGTTRDTIEEFMTIRGIPVNLVDTAGIHETEDQVEQMGIQRSKDAFNRADLVILICDGSGELTEEDRSLLDLLNHRPSLVLLNKRDLPAEITREEILKACPETAVFSTSALSGEGLEDVETCIEEMVFKGKASSGEGGFVTSLRHRDLLAKAKEELEEVLRMAELGEPLELMEISLRAAYDHLGEITGETANGDILDEVFSRFCLGK